MARLKRPLDRDAVKEADDKLYAEHADDPRPNALYDEDGHRRPLDPEDPEQEDLRNDWVALYQESLPADPASPPPPDSGSSEERPVADPCERCGNTDDIEFMVVPRHPEGVERPGYWPPKAGPNLYASEAFVAQLPNGERRGKLNGSGGASFSGIPGGACRFTMDQFFKPIADYLKRGVVFPPP
jgi:hypothetical protein